MFLIELLWNKHPPKKINSIYGYRTIRSMKNRETWEFAHKLCAKIRTICGISLEVFSILVIMLFSAYWDTAAAILLIIQLFVLLGSFYSQWNLHSNETLQKMDSEKNRLLQ